MIRLINLPSLIVSFIALAGCAVNVPQFDTARRLSEVVKSKPGTLAPYAWSFSMAGTEYTVYAVRASGNLVYFKNDYGMTVVWDGDSFVSMDNIPGSFGRYLSGREIVAGSEEGRWYNQEGFPVRKAVCTPPSVWRFSHDRFGWRQSCRSKVDGVDVIAEHVVEFDAESSIRRIEASVFPGGPKIVLRRLGS